MPAFIAAIGASMSTVKDNISRVRERISTAAARSRRPPEEITLVAVTKTVNSDSIRHAIAAGLTHFGENYVQEAREKIEVLHDPDIDWHFIGHLQTNKAKYAVRLFDWIHSLDSVKLVQELNNKASGAGRVIPCLIEVNLAGEESKFGVDQVRVVNLAEEVTRCSHLSLRGLMTMPPYTEEPERSRPYFVRLRGLKEALQEHHIMTTDLSMGMSADFEVAIEEGATIVRVGRAIFGERS